MSKSPVPGEDRGLLYAEACFETFRVIDGEVFNWAAHRARLQRGLEAFGIALPAGLEEQCLAAAAGQGRDALVRLTVTGGGQDRWGLAPAGGRQALAHIRVMAHAPRTTPLRLRSVCWPFPMRAKTAKFTADYAEILRGMHLQAKNVRAGEEALICRDELVYSGMTANILFYREGKWWTPPAPVGVLPGVIRQALLAAACVIESACPRGWLADCEAMALTNSGAFIQAVAAVDGRRLADSGEMFAMLWQALDGQAGVPEGMACV